MVESLGRHQGGNCEAALYLYAAASSSMKSSPDINRLLSRGYHSTPQSCGWWHNPPGTIRMGSMRPVAVFTIAVVSQSV